jgi:hypothetical protein
MELQLDLRKGELCRDRQYPVPSINLQSAAAQAFTVLDQENILRCFAVFCRKIASTSWIYAYDASRK